MLMEGAMPDAAQALALGLVDALAPADDVAATALAWLQRLLVLPRAPVLETRRIARRQVIDCLSDARIDLPRFVARWTDADTQAGLRAMMARIGK